MLSAFADAKKMVLDTCAQQLAALGPIEGRAVVLDKARGLFAEQFEKVQTRAEKRYLESVRAALKVVDPVFLEAEQVSQQIAKQIQFTRAAVPKTEEEMAKGLQNLSKFFTDFCAKKAPLEKIGRVKVDIALEIDETSLVELLLRFIKLTVTLQGQKKAELALSERKTRLETQLLQAAEQSQKSGASVQALKKQLQEKELEVSKLKRNESDAQKILKNQHEQKICDLEAALNESKQLLTKCQADKSQLDSKRKELETKYIEAMKRVEALESEHEYLKSKGMLAEREKFEQMQRVAAKVTEAEQKYKELGMAQKERDAQRAREQEERKMEDARYLKLVLITDQRVSLEFTHREQARITSVCKNLKLTQYSLNKHFNHPGVEWTQGFKRVGDIEVERGGESFKIVCYKARVDSTLLSEEKFIGMLESKKKEWSIHSVEVVHRSYSVS